MTYNLVSLNNISATVFNNRILNNISLNIPNKTTIALTGLSGSGKTTLVKLILELLLPEKGWVITGVMERFPGLRLGYVNQDAAFHLFANFVYEEFAQGSKEIAQSLLAKMECGYLLEKRSLELSQGEKTIVAILRALSLNTQLLILDEVMVNLSHQKRQLLQNILLEFAQNGGTTILVEHAPEFTKFANQQYFLLNGELSTNSNAPNNLHPLHHFTTTPAITPATNSSSLAVTDLQSQYIATSLTQPLNFTIAAGEILGICGDNGSGKSTLLEILCGIQKLKQGTIHWDEKELRRLRDCKTLFALYTKESTQQFLTPTVKEELLLSGADLDNTFISRFNLPKLLNRKISSLSFGEKQRLAIVLTLISNAKILVLDEPSYGMDAMTLQAFYLTMQLLRSQNKIIIIASHDSQLLTKCTNKIINL